MPQIINTNSASINAQRNLNQSQSGFQTALERLSSGLRINSAKDDAAGLAISTRFTSQVRGLEVAIRNSGDAVSLAQTAEGALGAMTENLQRIRELALQSANATNSAVDRQALNTEVDQLLQEIERVSTQTNFNGTLLLDGTFSAVTFQIGANEGESVSFGIDGATVDKLGAAASDGISSEPQAAAMLPGDLKINGFAIDGSAASDDTVSRFDQAQSAISKAAAINKSTENTGVEAVVNGTFVDGTAYTPANGNQAVLINGVSVNLVTSTALTGQVNLENVVSAINEKSGQSGVTASFSGNPALGVQLTAADGRNITLSSAGANTSTFGLAASSGAPGTTYSGSFTLVSRDGSNIELDTDTGNIGNAGLSVGTYSGNNSGAVGAAVGATAFAAGDVVINGVPVGPTQPNFDTASQTNPSFSAIAKAKAINDVSEQTGVTAKANPTVQNAGVIAPAANAHTFDINGVSYGVSVTATDTVADVQRAVVSAVNNKAGQTGVRAEAFNDTYRLIADDGRNITIANQSVNAGQLGLPANATTYSTISLESAGQIEVGTLTGNLATSGFTAGTYGSSETGGLVRDVDISTVDGAVRALKSVENALNTINFQRANLGAIQNRFESTITNQRITVENLEVANSRIRDADFAAETARLSREQVLQQAGLSILAQANAQPQQVLQLLQG
ncbi:MAG: flagellin [unclassified Hahellaceae]|nr:flagellin [Hahellaceae bacterium]|tara:strand:+ start:100019 stop:102055 length:2037 start_codon:yes stop_codon:yes gene_type:complete